jgi:hypothetical protein
MNSTEIKILQALAVEMTKTEDVIEAAWNVCHSFNDEAVAVWGSEYDGKVFQAVAKVIKDSFAQAVKA